MTDDGAFTFIALADAYPFRINSSTHYNVDSLPSSASDYWIHDTNTKVDIVNIWNGDSTRWFMAATTNAGMDGKFFHLIDTVTSENVCSSYDGLNNTSFDIKPTVDPNDSSAKLYKALAISGNGAYTYAATAGEVFVKQFNDGSTVQVETGEAFVLSKDMSLNERVFVNGDVVARAGFEVTDDVSFNANLFVGGDASMNSSLFVGGDVSMNSKLFVDGDVSTDSKLFVVGDASMNSKLFVDGDASMNSILSVGGDVSLDSDLHLSGNMGINKQANSDIVLDISASNAMRLPKGETSERPVQNGADASYKGIIRYNSETDQFEGFGAGDTWGSLGGIIDVDQDTYVKAETAAGDDNDQLQFFTDGTNRMTITSTGDVSMNQKLIVDGDASFNSNVNVNGTLNVTGAVNLTEYNNEYITNIDTTNYTLIVTEDLSLNGNMNVDGTAGIADTLTLNKATGTGLDVKSDANVDGNFILGGTIDAEGTADIADTLTLSKSSGTGLSVTSNATVGGTLTVTGDTTFNDDVKLINNSAVQKVFMQASSGNITTEGYLWSNNQLVIGNTDKFTVVGSTGETIVGGNFKINNSSGTEKFEVKSSSGNTQIAGTLELTGALDANSTADIADTLTLSKAAGTGTGLDVKADAIIGGVLTLTGALSASNTAEITDTLTLSKGSGTGLQVDADAAIKGSLTVGVDGDEFTITESGDDITLANTIQDKDVIFTANNGGSTTEFLRLDASDAKLRVGAEMAVGAHIIPNAADTVSLGSSTYPFKDIYVSENSIIFGDATNSAKFAVSNTGEISIQPQQNGADQGTAKQYLVQDSLASVDGIVTTSDISANTNMSIGGDLSLNGGILIGGDISWNSANIPADSIPSSAIIGGVGSNDFGSHVTMSSTLYVDGDISFNSQMNMGGHIIPRVNAAYDLGNAEYKIRHCFLSDNSLWVGDQHKISIDNGKMKFKEIDNTVIPSGLQGIDNVETQILNFTGKSSLSEVKLAEYLAWAIQSGETVNGKTGNAITIDDIYTSDASNFASVTSADPTGSDLSLNQTFSVGGHSFFGSDVSFNSGINIAGDISWNSVNIPDDSIPATAIIGGVGGDPNNIDGDLNVKTGFIKQF